MKYKEKTKEYQKECSENEKYNKDIKNEQLKELNEILLNKGFDPVTEL